jgi:hypothetical protein
MQRANDARDDCRRRHALAEISIGPKAGVMLVPDIGRQRGVIGITRCTTGKEGLRIWNVQ